MGFGTKIYVLEEVICLQAVSEEAINGLVFLCFLEAGKELVTLFQSVCVIELLMSGLACEVWGV
jgi:hypothetical protein